MGKNLKGKELGKGIVQRNAKNIISILKQIKAFLKVVESSHLK